MRKTSFAVATAAALSLLSGCGSFSSRTAKMRTALDAGQPRVALDALDKELGVKGDGELPRKLVNDDALLVLDRASVQQSMASFDLSRRDFEAADKAIDVLDLNHGTSDDIARWVFSDSAGRYVAPPHEKLLVNTLNMVNYLELGDLSGARVEARRLGVTTTYLRDFADRSENPVLGVGALLAGFAFEKSGEPDAAYLYYRDAFKARRSPLLAAPLRSLVDNGWNRHKEIVEFAHDPSSGPSGPSDDEGEVLLVVGYGRVPHRIAERVPIGLALTRCSGALAGQDRTKAGELAAQGLVTWVNFPTLAPEPDNLEAPIATIDGMPAVLDAPLDVAGEVRKEWKRIEGDVMAAAVTRTVARVVVGKAIEAGTSASKDNNVKAIGLVVSLVTQVAMTAADVPDTRSWEALPARLSLARVKVRAGDHHVVIDGRGWRREQKVSIKPGGWAAVSLMALR